MGLKKKTIFKLFVIPLMVIIVFQALISYATIYLSGSTHLIDEYSVGILEQTVENRKILLENNMVQQWSSVSEEVDQINSALKELLSAEKADMETFMSSKALKDKLLHQMLTNCLYMMRKNAVTGAFIILANDKEAEDGQQLQGIYFRDADPYTNPADYSDVLMERGSSQFSHEMNIPFGSYWTADFHLNKRGESEADDFFYKPFDAAKKQVMDGYKNLAYWSGLFCLEDNPKDSYRMITYSVPLINSQGVVYGVLGIELSQKHISGLLPFKELNSGDQSGYVLMKHKNSGWTPVISTGMLATRQLQQQPVIEMRETEYENLFQIENEAGENTDLYASVSQFHLYNTNTVFGDEVWAVAGIQQEVNLFGIGDRIVRALNFAIIVSLIFSIVSIYIVTKKTTRPIRRLADCIRQSSENHLEEFERTDIVEVDELYDVVRHLTDTQKEAEYNILEEKERYRIALESSKDMFFTYDLENRTIDIFNFIAPDRQVKEYHKITAEQLPVDIHQIFQEDLDKLNKLFTTRSGELSMPFRIKAEKSPEGYRWLEINGKVIFDSNKKRSKIIGSIKDIHEQKMKELINRENVRRDVVTGLYRRQIGESYIISALKTHKQGSLVIIDIDRFREINETYGMVFGDAILEEIGRIISLMKADARRELPGKLTAVRVGGDEILIWLEDFNEAQTEDFAEALRTKITSLFAGGSFELSISAGISCRSRYMESYRELLAHAKIALKAAKQPESSHIVFFHHLDDEQRRLAIPADIDDIASLNYDGKMNIVSLVFNFFDKGGDIASIMSVLFVKLGRYYGAEDITITSVDWDFNTAYISYQWHAQNKPWPNKIQYFPPDRFRTLVKKAGSKNIQLSDNRQDPELKQFLRLDKDIQGVAFPMFDNGRYMGSMIFGTSRALSWSADDEGKLQEIVKIVETNINREKYDLASRAKSDFLSRMSHEIRTPMNAIIGMTSIALEAKNRPEKVADCLNKIEQSSQYLLRLINDVLDMSKIESGKMKLEEHNFNMTELIGQIDVLIRPQAAEHHIEYVVHTEIDEAWVIGDSLHLNQVLINLLSNALKFTPEGGVIKLTAIQKVYSESEVSMYFSVCDNGIGISEENKDRIFDSFEQAEESTGREYGGTGLGLPISNRLVRMMGGNIELESAAGEGSKFYFSIILRKGQPEQASSQPEPVDESIFKGKRVLLVEDNDLNAEIAGTILEMHGFIQDRAANGKEALKMFSDKGPGYYALILMDIRMPVMDGLEATKHIRCMSREDAHSIPIIAMTANAFDEDMRKSIESGMNGHLAKPIDVHALLKMISKVIAR